MWGLDETIDKKDTTINKNDEGQTQKKKKRKKATLAILLCPCSSSWGRLSSLPCPISMPFQAVWFQMSLKNKMVAADGHT